MEYLISGNQLCVTEASSAMRNQAGGYPDQREGGSNRGTLIARANRLYAVGELALAARLLMDSEASLC
jgi:hypothetical protein